MTTVLDGSLLFPSLKGAVWGRFLETVQKAPSSERRAAGTQWKASISCRFKNRLGVWVACKRLNLSFCTWRALRDRIRGSVEEIFKNKS